MASVSLSRADKIKDTPEAVAQLRGMEATLRTRAFGKYFGGSASSINSPCQDLCEVVGLLKVNGYRQIKSLGFVFSYETFYFEKDGFIKADQSSLCMGY